MFSKRMMVIAGVIFLITMNMILLSVSSRRSYSPHRVAETTIPFLAPFQNAVTSSIRYLRDIWSTYFSLVSVAEENKRLKAALRNATEKMNRCEEIEISNARLRELLSFQRKINQKMLPAEVIGRSPSAWSKTAIINQGKNSGIKKGLPVVVPEGIVGQVISVSRNYSKVLLITDQNSALDGMVQRTRSRGIVQGDSTELCLFKYVLRKDDIREGDIVISSGLDGIYPKGLMIGKITEASKNKSGIFQEVAITPDVDFEKLEEVMIILEPLLENRVGEK
jgi:rod shape-determining protein MreC